MEAIRPLLPEGFDIDRHFTPPRYRPWQHRIAIVPDGDLFAALREGKASVVTDTIETFTEHGIKVSSGEEIPADIVVTATRLQPLGLRRRGVRRRRRAGRFYRTGHLAWRHDQRRAEHGLHVSATSGTAGPCGWTWSATWSSACCRTWRTRAPRCRPHAAPAGQGHADTAVVRSGELPNAGYVMRSQDILFKQGDREPWIHMLEHDEESRSCPRRTSTDGSTSTAEPHFRSPVTSGPSLSLNLAGVRRCCPACGTSFVPGLVSRHHMVWMIYRSRYRSPSS